MNFSDLGMGNLKSVAGAMDQVGDRAAAASSRGSAFSTMSGAVSQARQRNAPAFGGSNDDSKKKDGTSSADIDPNGPDASRARFGQSNDLTMDTISGSAANRADKDDTRRKKTKRIRTRPTKRKKTKRKKTRKRKKRKSSPKRRRSSAAKSRPLP